MTCNPQVLADSQVVEALLHEIAEHLAAFIETGAKATIDLRSLPIGEGDRARLEALLGAGEVAARIELAGPSDLWETAYSGVWWLRHGSDGGGTIAEQILITDCPEILKTHCDDASAALRRLQRHLSP